MREHGLMFRAEMVRALLRKIDPKTQTRRLDLNKRWDVGDRIWVKETWCIGKVEETDEPDGWPGKLYISQAIGDDHLIFRADMQDVDDSETIWRPSLFMFRKQSRITLEITGLREERLHNITLGDVKAEGIWLEDVHYHEGAGDRMTRYFDAYRKLWESINGPGRWDENPVVRVIEFKRLAP